VLSIKTGTITASTILGKLNTYSHKNKLYQAFRELGRIIRTGSCCNTWVILTSEPLFRVRQTRANRSTTLPSGLRLVMLDHPDEQSA